MNVSFDYSYLRFPRDIRGQFEALINSATFGIGPGDFTFIT